MAYIQTRFVGAGELISGTFVELASIPRELAIYFAGFIAAALLVDWVPASIGVITPIAFVAYFPAQYWLYRSLFVKSGYPIDHRFKAFSLFAMAAILSLPIMFGVQFFYVPGLLLAAKWVMAPSFLVAEERNLFESIGDAWNASSNNLLSLSIAFATLAVIWLVVFFVAVGFAGSLTGSLGFFGSLGNGNMAFFWITMHVLPVLLMGLSVSAYRALAGPQTSIAEVFE